MLPRAQLIRIIVAIVVVTVAGSAILLQIDWMPVAGSKEAGPIDTMLDVMIVLSTFVFAVVIVMLLHSVYRYRARPGDLSDGEPIHGNTVLEIVWTAIPTVIVAFGAVYSAIVLADIEKRDPGRMVVKVTSQQFAWSFEYPRERIETTELTVPKGRQVEFQLHSKDVIHSFWVPAWRIKKDNVPGIVTRAFVTPSRLGSFPLICAELCGLGHSTMRTRAHVVEPAEYKSWVAEQQRKQGVEPGAPPGAARRAPKAPVAGAALAARGSQVFTAQGCASCHTLEAAGSKATIGPDLDRNLAARDRAFIRRSIADPSAEIAAGFKDGIMPATFAKLPKRDLDALVEFLAVSTGARK